MGSAARTLLIVAILALVWLVSASSAEASSAAIDTTYGERGIASPTDSSRLSFGIASHTSGDGLVVSGVQTSFLTAGDGDGLDIRVHPTVHRFRADGSPDPAFGAGGVAKVYLQDHFSLATAIDEQADGRLVVAGMTIGILSASTFVARLNPDGSLDTTFGRDGSLKVLPQELNALMPISIDVLADGRLLVVASSFSGDLSKLEEDTPRRRADLDVVLLRFTADGRLDPTFGTGGILAWDSVGTDSLDVALGSHVTPDGHVLVAGTAIGDKLDRSRALLVKFLPDGTLDSAFGTAGVAPQPARKGLSETVTAVEPGPAGTTVFSVMSANEGTEEDDGDDGGFTAVRRLNAAGRQLAWPAGGIDAKVPTSMVPSTLLPMDDGRVLVGGAGSRWGTAELLDEGLSGALVMLRPSGNRDRTFSGSEPAFVGSSVGAAPVSMLAGLHHGPGGTIVATGTVDGALGAMRMQGDSAAGGAARASTIRASLVRPRMRRCGFDRMHPCRIVVRRGEGASVDVRFATTGGVATGTRVHVRIDRDDDDGLYWDVTMRATSVRAGGVARLRSAFLSTDGGVHRIQAVVDAGPGTTGSRSDPFYVRVLDRTPNAYRGYDDEEIEIMSSTRRVCAAARDWSGLTRLHVRMACNAATSARRAGMSRREYARRILGR
jgi:uncharacterized delta-60 repeat protein